MKDVHQLVGVQRAAEAGFGVRNDRSQPVGRVVALGVRDLVGAAQRVVDPPHECRRAVRRVQALIRVGVPGQVRICCDLPAGEVDRLQAGPTICTACPPVSAPRATTQSLARRDVRSRSAPTGPACSTVMEGAAEAFDGLAGSRDVRARAVRDMRSGAPFRSRFCLFSDPNRENIAQQPQKFNFSDPKWFGCGMRQVCAEHSRAVTTLSTKADDIARVLEDEIVGGDPPGTVMRQEQLSERSRSPERRYARRYDGWRR